MGGGDRALARTAAAAWAAGRKAAGASAALLVVFAGFCPDLRPHNGCRQRRGGTERASQHVGSWVGGQWAQAAVQCRHMRAAFSLDCGIGVEVVGKAAYLVHRVQLDLCATSTRSTSSAIASLNIYQLLRELAAHTARSPLL